MIRQLQHFLRVLTWIVLLAPLSSLGQKSVNEWVYVVQANDTLEGISREFLVSPTLWRQLQKYNNLEMSPEMLPIGLTLRIPNAWSNGTRGRNAINGAMLDQVTGTVYVTSLNMPEQRAKAGDFVAVGTKVSTAANSSAVLRLADNTQINLWPQSKLRLEKLEVGRKPQIIDADLNLPQGEVRITVPRPLNSRKNINVQTPSAVAAVQGTSFWVSSQSDRTLTQTYEGIVLVQAQDGDIFVRSDEEVFVALGKHPSPAEPQRKAPVIENLATTLATLPTHLSWSSPTAAVQWRIQIAQDSDFEKIVFQDTIKGPQVDWPMLANGRWWLRVQALDAQQMPSQAFEQSLDVQIQRDYLGYTAIDSTQQLGQTLNIQLPELQSQECYLLERSLDVDGKDVIWRRVQYLRTLTLSIDPKTPTQYLHIIRIRACTAP